MTAYVFDIEANGLLDHTAIDYTSLPYKLKPTFKIHCCVFLHKDTKEVVSFVGDECQNIKTFILENVTELIAHNSIQYDHLVLKLALGIDYTVYPDTVAGKEAIITDTLVMSKTLNPDRPAHSVDYFGGILGLQKIDWRAKAVELGLIDSSSPKGAEFAVYHPEMLQYNIRDCEVTLKIYNYLMKEWGDWSWDNAYQLEKAVKEIITRQEHRGFYFDHEKAKLLVSDLDNKMEVIREVVEPLIPPKPLSKAAMAVYTPPEKQFKKDGTPNAHIVNFIAKHGGTLQESGDKWIAEVLGNEYILPISHESLVKTMEATIADTTHLKGWLVGLGWQATAYKERDLTVNSKKQKLSQEQFETSVTRYVEQTLESPFCKDRLEHIGCSKFGLLSKLIRHDLSRPLQVLTNPTLTVGQDKEIDPKLLELSEKFAYAKEVSEYLTYRHRRNSILGGNVDPDDEDEAEKGYLSCERIYVDHRIPTPADTCGAGTSRFKHRLVANIPRSSSLYGKEMRSLFGVSNDYYQIGYDFNSLEAMIEAHYVYNYTGGIEYGISLIAEKPNDCHTVLATKISGLIGKPFPRITAKSVKYGCSYNAQVARVAKIVGCDIATAQVIFDAFWDNARSLKELKERMQKYWETTGKKKFLLGIDGRKLPIRSKGNVVNSAFQSAGVLCAKRAMILHDRKLKEAGLLCDVFRDNGEKPHTNQLIAYHDECQLEVSKKLVKFKVFSNEQEAKDFKYLHPTWSDIGYTDKGWYVGYCLVGELAQQSVKEAGEYYNLNVELTAGYSVGRNWQECH